MDESKDRSIHHNILKGNYLITLCLLCIDIFSVLYFTISSFLFRFANYLLKDHTQVAIHYNIHNQQDSFLPKWLLFVIFLGIESLILFILYFQLLLY